MPYEYDPFCGCAKCAKARSGVASLAPSPPADAGDDDVLREVGPADPATVRVAHLGDALLRVAVHLCERDALVRVLQDWENHVDNYEHSDLMGLKTLLADCRTALHPPETREHQR